MLVLGGALSASAQNRICGHEIFQQEIDNSPELKVAQEAYFKNYAEDSRQYAAEAARMSAKGTADYPKVTIPVVFHIVLSELQITQLGGEAGVIERVNSQLAAINEDFGAYNRDTANIPTDFKPLMGKANITFALAKRDTLGKAKLGIIYAKKPATFNGFSAQDNSVKATLYGGDDAWDYTKYLNVWVTNITSTQDAGQVLGYAYNADYAMNVVRTTPYHAGVVVHYLAFGRRTNIGQRFFSSRAERGRTMTHELGHFFNIWHIWGTSAPVTSTNCNDDDGIDDTPVQAGGNQSCPSGIKPNCANSPFVGGEMYMNFMDYSTDDCTRMFSAGQVARMRGQISLAGTQYYLAQHPELTQWPTDVSPVEYNNKVEVGPNPTNGNFNIYLYEKYDELKSIKIMNAVGQVVKNITVTDQQNVNYNINISDMPKGIYIAHIEFDLGVISKKIVVQ